MSEQLPRGWDEFRLIEVADQSDRYSFTGGPFGSNLKTTDYTQYGIRIIQLQNIGEGEFLNKYKIYTSPEKADELKSCNIYPGDIIMSKMGDPVARATIIPDYSERYLMASDGIRLSVEGSRFDTKFVHEAINSDYFRYKAEISSTGTTRKRIGLTELRELSILAPCLDEQQRVATALTSVDEVIQRTESQINKLQDLKKGMMQELLTKGIGHTEFKDGPVGRIPETWDVLSCDDVCQKIVVGIVIKPTQYYASSGIPALRSANVRETGLNKNNLKYISEDSNELLKKSKVQAGDILTVRTGYPGTSAVVTEEYEGCNCIDIIISRPKATVNSDYMCYWINSDFGKGQVLQSQGGLAQQHFNVGDMKKLLVALPSEREQGEIASALKSAEHYIELIHRRLKRFQNMKMALMQDLLTGKVRVTVN